MGQISIVGSGHTLFGRLEQDNLESLIVKAGQQALNEAGICAQEIDAIFIGNFNAGMVEDSFASSLALQIDDNLRFKPSTRFENACASGSAAIWGALHMLLSKQARTVLVIGAEKMTAKTTAQITDSLRQAGYQNDAHEAQHSFPQVFAALASDYAMRYCDPLDAMAQIAAKNHHNACFNPLAQMQKDLSVAFCKTVSEKNPLIAPPLRMSDCSLISDGAAALVLTHSEHASNFKKAAHFRAFQQVNDFLPLSKRDFLKFEGAHKAFHAAYEQAGINVSDLNFAEVHDCFTIAELVIYEAMGLCPPGQGAKLLHDGIVYRDGKLPINLSGGLKAKGHPVGATGVSMHVMAYRQLTNQAGAMQCDNAELGAIFNMGGAAVANYVSILEAGHC